MLLSLDSKIYNSQNIIVYFLLSSSTSGKVSKTALLYSHLGTQADSDSFVFNMCSPRRLPQRSSPFQPVRGGKEYGGACTDFYGSDLEVVHVTYTHILFARTQSYGHAQLQGRLGSIIQASAQQEEEKMGFDEKLAVLPLQSSLKQNSMTHLAFSSRVHLPLFCLLSRFHNFFSISL